MCSKQDEALTSVTAEEVKPSHVASGTAPQDIEAHWAFVPFLILLALGLGLVLTFAGVMAVWKTGVIHDPDDAMRLVQVRALLAGQNWYDMTAYRLDPPAGSIMHWSRVVDLPLAILIKSFAVFLPVEAAERLTRIVFPLLLQAGLYVAIVRLAKSLLGREAIMPAIFTVLLSGIAFGQFQPGRIDHHAPQIVLLVFMLGGLIDSVKPQRVLPAAIAGGLAALSMAISLENLPFILTLWGLAAGLWIWQGHTARASMAGFALGLLIGLPLSFLATVGPAHWFLSVPDAFSFGQLIAGMGGALVCLALAYLPGRFSHRSVRLALAASGAALVLGLVALVGRGALQGPFAGIDPLVRDIWLLNVHEAWTFFRLMHREPDTAAIFMLPLALGLAASIAAVFWETETNRLQWMFVAGTCLIGLAASLFFIRVMSSAGPIAPLGGVWAVMQLKKDLLRRGKRHAAVCSFILLLPFASVPWALAIGSDASKPKQGLEDCLASSAFGPFGTLPPGLILAPIDAGSHLLAFTPHTVLAAPYHRNNHGNKLALDAFLASPEDSRAIVMASGAKYLAVCPSLDETSVLGKRGPRSLAAALVEGQVPDWLVPVAAANTPYKIFTVRR